MALTPREDRRGLFWTPCPSTVARGRGAASTVWYRQATRRAAYRSCMRRARGDPYVSIKDESCDWRTLALGIASLLTQMPEQTPQEDMLNVVARQLKAPVATLRAHAGRLPAQVVG